MTGRDGGTRLSEIAARAEAATPGPWHIEESRWDIPGCAEVDRIVCGPSPSGVPRDGIADVFDGHWVEGDEEPGSAPNLQFIAHARSDVPWLLAEVERLRAERDNWRTRHLETNSTLVDVLAEVERLRAESDRVGDWIDDYKREQERIIGRYMDRLAEVAARHQPYPLDDRTLCRHCGREWPCLDAVTAGETG